MDLQPQANPVEAPSGAASITECDYCVSYAWGDDTPEGKARDAYVEQLCAEAERRNLHVLRDRKDMRVGDRITEFMRKLAKGKRIFIILSDKYLRSPNCTFELFEVWRNRRMDDQDFLRRVRIFKLPDVRIAELAERKVYYDWWQQRLAVRDALNDELKDKVSVLDFQRYKAMRQFADSVLEILAVVADTLQPATWEDFLKYGFDDASVVCSPPTRLNSPIDNTVAQEKMETVPLVIPPAPKERVARFVKKAHRHISVFVAHAREDNDEAKQCCEMLNNNFDVWKYDVRASTQHLKVVEKEICSRQFFLLLVSQLFPKKQLLQRELGLAIAAQKRNRGFRPLLIPVFSSKVAWDHNNLVAEFTTRDFTSGEPSATFVPNITALDEIGDSITSKEELLISYMKPQLMISRIDFYDRDVFFETDVFTLYEDLFPPEERDAPNDIMDWVLETDIGETRYVTLNDEIQFEYRSDSRYCILTLAKKAIGLAFLTYDYHYSIMHGNYLAVQESWRAYGIAAAFVEAIKEAFTKEQLFDNCRGIVFEVETFDKSEIVRIISYLEDPVNKKQFLRPEDRDHIRKFMRVIWYEGMGYKFFLNKQTAKPITCIGPCLDPQLPITEWRTNEQEYWLMWKGMYGVLDVPNFRQLWEDCVKCVYIEVLTKSLVDRCPDQGVEYWNYSNKLIYGLLDLHKNTDISLGNYLRKEYDLVRRWENLKIAIAV